MLSLLINRDDLAKSWTKFQDCWTFGNSYIKPFDHPVLEAFLVSDSQRHLVVVRERHRDLSLPHDSKDKYPEIHVSKEEYNLLIDNIKCWQLEFVTVEFTKCEANLDENTIFTIEIQAGKWGTVPIYLLSNRSTIACDWDITKLYQFINVESLDFIQAAHFLSGLTHYSSKTLFKDIKVLTERSKAILSREETRIDYPEPAPLILTYELEDNAEVTHFYREILSASLRRWFPISGDRCFGCELSGGLDSANVTAVASNVYDHPISTYGMLLAGDMGRHQVARRQELIQKFNATDRTVDAIAFPPLTPKGSRWHRKKIWAYDEPYSEALESMLSIARSNDSSIILTGIGGDELVLPDWFEVEDYHKNAEGKKNRFLNNYMSHINGYMPNFVREFCMDAEISTPAAPKPIIPESALMASRCRAPVFLRNGIWPINPLCTPELVNYCHSLPLNWRAKKYLHRKLLLEHGISENTVYPKVRENFSGIMAHAVSNNSKQLIKNLLSSLTISELGLIDGKKITCEYDNFLNGKSTHNPGMFYDVCILELTIRSVANKI